ncbi:NAD-dependent epimerase/dehydratase family protein [Prevotella sp. P6B4]|uniref:NAD-dependent epimerase/dehydratase family protein n=1 Tax=Prevotella sp. P6B4 TaxID=1410614 RepID=UPI000568038F|nr:NAD-dependent epimerase/dehydratase family protein [Prevotella sp. P6B4]
MVIIEDLQRMSEARLPWRELDGKTILVTGATGMLASYVTWLLLYLHEHAGIHVSIVALCRNRQKAEQYFGSYVGKPYFHFLIQDVCDPIAYEGNVDYVFHLAGNASPHYINTDPVGIMKCNLLGTMNVLEYARDCQTKKVIFASTREVYGKNEEAEHLNEQAFGTLDPLDDRSCYPESKRAAETLLKSYYLQYGVNFNAIRIAHSYGPTMTLENDGRVMADLMGDVVAGRDIVLKSSGEAVRAFLYISDAVVGMFTVLFHGQTAKAYNLANETEPISIRNLAQLLVSTSKNTTMQVVVSECEQKGYCAYRRTALDTSAIQQLGWKPMVSLKAGIERVLHYFTSTENPLPIGRG